MENLINFVKDNWPIIAPVCIAAISEIMALNPKWKGNGILDVLLKIIKK